MLHTIWPGARSAQVLPKADTGRATRAGVAVATRPGTEMLVSSRWDFVSEGNKCLIQTVVTKVNRNTQLIGLYVSPQIKGAFLVETLETLKRKETGRKILVGDLNARSTARGTVR